MNKDKGYQEKLIKKIAKHEKNLQKLNNYYQGCVNKHKQPENQPLKSNNTYVKGDNDDVGNKCRNDLIICGDDLTISQDSALFLPTLQMFDDHNDENKKLNKDENDGDSDYGESNYTLTDIAEPNNSIEIVEDDSLLILDAKANTPYKSSSPNIASTAVDEIAEDLCHSPRISNTNKKFRRQTVDSKIKSLNWTINSSTDNDIGECTPSYEFRLQSCLEVKESIKSIAFSNSNDNCRNSIKIATCSDRMITLWTSSSDKLCQWNFIKCLECDKDMEEFTEIDFLPTDSGICLSVTGKFRASHNRIYRITDKEDFSLELRSGCAKFPCKCQYQSVNCPPGHNDIVTAILNNNDKSYYIKKYCLDDKCQNLIACDDFKNPNILEKLSSIVTVRGSEAMLFGLFERTVVLWNWNSCQIITKIPLEESFIVGADAKCFQVVMEKEWLFTVIGSSFDKMKYNDLSVPNCCLFAINHTNNRIVKLRSYEIQDNDNTQRINIQLCSVSQMHLVSVTRCNSVYLWNLFTSACLAEIPYQGTSITGIQLHPKLHLFALATDSNCVHIYTKVKTNIQFNKQSS